MIPAISRLSTAFALATLCALAMPAHAQTAATLSTVASSVDVATLPTPKKTVLGLYLEPKDVMAAVTDEAAEKTLFLDVRTPEELTFVGTPTVADANVPFSVMSPMMEFDAEKGAYKLVPNGHFVSDVEARLALKNLNKNDRVILVCRSGERSARAADVLAKAGFTQVYNVVEGFEGDYGKTGRRDVNGWKNAGLPWTYKLDKAKIAANH